MDILKEDRKMMAKGRYLYSGKKLLSQGHKAVVAWKTVFTRVLR